MIRLDFKNIVIQRLMFNDIQFYLFAFNHKTFQQRKLENLKYIVTPLHFIEQQITQNMKFFLPSSSIAIALTAFAGTMSNHCVHGVEATLINPQQLRKTAPIAIKQKGEGKVGSIRELQTLTCDDIFGVDSNHEGVGEDLGYGNNEYLLNNVCNGNPLVITLADNAIVQGVPIACFVDLLPVFSSIGVDPPVVACDKEGDELLCPVIRQSRDSLSGTGQESGGKELDQVAICKPNVCNANIDEFNEFLSAVIPIFGYVVDDGAYLISCSCTESFYNSAYAEGENNEYMEAGGFTPDSGLGDRNNHVCATSPQSACVNVTLFDVTIGHPHSHFTQPICRDGCDSLDYAGDSTGSGFNFNSYVAYLQTNPASNNYCLSGLEVTMTPSNEEFDSTKSCTSKAAKARRASCPSKSTSTKAPGSTKAPKATKAPGSSKAPKSTKAPGSSKAPKSTKAPGSIKAPKATKAPGSSKAPKSIKAPGSSKAPKSTKAPGSTKAPKVSPPKGGTPSVSYPITSGAVASAAVVATIGFAL
jgi:hypothetical protein